VVVKLGSDQERTDEIEQCQWTIGKWPWSPTSGGMNGKIYFRLPAGGDFSRPIASLKSIEVLPDSTPPSNRRRLRVKTKDGESADLVASTNKMFGVLANGQILSTVMFTDELVQVQRIDFLERPGGE
jgi:hypothetical protein